MSCHQFDDTSNVLNMLKGAEEISFMRVNGKMLEQIEKLKIEYTYFNNIL